MQTCLQKPELFKTAKIGSGTWLSVKDVQKLKSMYGCPSEHHAIILKTGLLKRSQKYELAMLRLFLVIFLQTALKYFTNWGADGHFEVHNMSKSQLDQKLEHKSQRY